MKKDIFITSIIQIAVMLSAFVIYKLVSHLFGEVAFSEFSIIKRYSAFIIPVFMLALMITLPKFIAYSSKYARLYLSVSAILVLINSLILISITFFLKEEITNILFGIDSIKDFDLLLCISFTSIAYMWHTILYGYFRGLRRMSISNLINFFNMIIFPLIAFLFTDNLTTYIYLNSFLVFLLSSLLITYIIVQKSLFIKIKILKKYIFKIFTYGIKRVPANVGQMFLFTIPVLIAIQYYNTVTVGYIAFSISLVAMAGSFFQPLSLVLLPNISVLIKEKKISLFKKYYQRLIFLIPISSIIGILIFQIFTTNIISIIIDIKFTNEIVEIFQLTFFATLGYSFYVVFRIIIEAYYHKPKNTYNILLAIGIYFIIYILCKLFLIRLDFLYAFVISLSFLGIKSIYDCNKIFVKEVF